MLPLMLREIEGTTDDYVHFAPPAFDHPIIQFLRGINEMVLRTVSIKRFVSAEAEDKAGGGLVFFAEVEPPSGRVHGDSLQIGRRVAHHPQLDARMLEQPIVLLSILHLAAQQVDLAAYFHFALLEPPRLPAEIVEREAKMYYTIYLEILDEVKWFAEQNGIDLVLRVSESQNNFDDPRAVMMEIQKPVVYKNTGIDITPHITQQLKRRQPAGPVGQRPQGPRVPSLLEFLRT